MSLIIDSNTFKFCGHHEQWFSAKLAITGIFAPILSHKTQDLW
jgi:hypothetical protein